MRFPEILHPPHSKNVSALQVNLQLFPTLPVLMQHQPKAKLIAHVDNEVTQNDQSADRYVDTCDPDREVAEGKVILDADNVECYEAERGDHDTDLAYCLQKQLLFVDE